MQLKVFLALAALAFVPSEGAENRAATGLASEVAGLLRGIVTMCYSNGRGCSTNSQCCSGYCYPGGQGARGGNYCMATIAAPSRGGHV